jgi:hypothetical protein
MIIIPLGNTRRSIAAPAPVPVLRTLWAALSTLVRGSAAVNELIMLGDLHPIARSPVAPLVSYEALVFCTVIIRSPFAVF